jgi:hypothetical protein
VNAFSEQIELTLILLSTVGSKQLMKGLGEVSTEKKNY